MGIDVDQTEQIDVCFAFSVKVTSGAQLGPYEIGTALGAGGMGEVYRARDARLGRNVAIKVLPHSVSLDPERLRRFEREARSASALNHPNIVTIYEVGSFDGVSYIAMELVEGAPLRAKMHGPLDVRTLLHIASQLAAGLAAAHESGIVHRDLKPENVMVTKDGFVKILDFGLAKLFFTGQEMDTQTATETATRPGGVWGTPAYMSPEQASGSSLDFRSDQFSLGSMLYEMASGKRAFDRPTGSQTLASIIEDEPQPIALINPQMPTPLRWIIERCLSKERDARYAATKDLARDLATLRDHLQEISGSVTVGAAPPGRVRSIAPALLVLVAVAALGITALLMKERDYFWRNPLTGAHFTRFTDWQGDELDASISPDGKFATFLSDRDGVFDVWVGQIGSGEFLNLTKGQYPSVANPILRNVSFSDDSTHVAFRIDNSADGKKHRVLLVPTIGGTPQPFLPSAVEAEWSPDHNHIAFYKPDPGDPIYVADRNGGNPAQICVDKPGIHQHYLSWSPDSRYIYFVRGIPPDGMDVWRVEATGGAAERLTHHNSRVSCPTLLDNRTLIYVGPRTDGSGSGLYTMDVGHRIPHAVTAGLEEYVSVSASTDGQRVLATVANPIRDLWIAPITDHAVEESAVHRFALPTLRAASPRYGPDYVLYVGSKGAADSLWKIKDASESELWKGQGAVPSAPAVSPDGSQICFLVSSRGKAHLHVMAADGTNVRELDGSLEVRGAPSWSPDGKWVAVAATEGKANPMFKVPVEGGAPVRLVSGVDSVISNPVWSPDGRLILYSVGQGSATVRLKGITPDGQPFAVPEIWVGNTGDRYRFLPDGKNVVISKGVLWVQNFSLLNLATGQLRELTHLNRQFITRSFDVSPDGKQILFDRYRQNSDIVLIDLPQR
jgi:serine/threonine protein kinase/Tol biopolymer transport system component